MNTIFSSIPNVAIPKFTASDTDEKTPYNFSCFEIQKGMSNNIHGVYYTTDNASDAVDIEASNTEAPEDGWWCPNCVLVVAGTNTSTGGTLFASPQSDPKSVKVGGTYLFGGIFCPDNDLCDFFTSPIIKDSLADKGLDVDCELRKGNISASSMRIGVSSTEVFEAVCNEDECITAFESDFILPLEGGHIKNRICMNFDKTKGPEKLMGKELCLGFVSTEVSPIPPIEDWENVLSFFDDISIGSCTTTINNLGNPSSETTCDCLVCTGGKEVEFNCPEVGLETACMVTDNVNNLGVLSIPQFKDDNSVGLFSVSLSLALIVLASALVYTPLS